MKYPNILRYTFPNCLALLCCVTSLSGADDDASSTPPGAAPVALDAGLAKAEATVKQLLGRGRKLDPFGMSMNPNVVATLEIDAPPPDFEDEAHPKSSLQEALERLTITGVIPRRKMVIIGSRTLRAGEEFVIEKDSFVFKLKLTNVALEGITVADLDSQESAFLPLGIAPSLTKGGPTFPPDQFQRQSSILTIK